MKFFDINSLMDEEKFALFYGVLLGDGCLSHCNAKRKSGKTRELFIVCITGSFADDKEFYQETLVPLLKSFGRKSITIKDRSYAGAIEINFSDRELFDKISSYGFPIGKKGTKIQIPRYFYDKNLLKYVVAGFLATDGSLVLTKNPNKYYPRIEGNGISERLIKQVQEYLLDVGMKGSFYLAKRKERRNSNWQQQYRFQFNGKENLLLFNNLIGFINPKHQIRFEDFITYSELYDRKIKGIPTQMQKNIRLNTFMAEEGVEPPTSSS